MPLETLCVFLHTIEVVIVPLVFTLIIVSLVWAMFEYITIGDYDLFHTIRAKALMVWATLALGALMLIFALVLFVFSVMGVTHTTCQIA